MAYIDWVATEADVGEAVKSSVQSDGLGMTLCLPFPVFIFYNFLEVLPPLTHINTSSDPYYLSLI
jgi:hypothetical protein